MALAEADGFKVVYIPVGELSEFEGNPRVRTDYVLKKLMRSILEFGFVDPVIIWENAEEFGYPKYTILGGHRRLDALIAIIEENTPAILDEINGLVSGKIPVHPVSLGTLEGIKDEAEREAERQKIIGRAKALLVALNKIGEDFDVPMLKDILTEIDMGAFDVEVSGFEQVEIEDLIQYKDPRAEEGEVSLKVTITFANLEDREKFFRMLDYFEPAADKIETKIAALVEGVYDKIIPAGAE